MITKHDIGEEIFIKAKVSQIHIGEDIVRYRCVLPERSMSNVSFVDIEDKDLRQGDWVTIETYEAEVNKLKSIIEEKNREIGRLKGRITNADFSHHPQENIYAKSLKNFDAEKERDKEDWRMP